MEKNKKQSDRYIYGSVAYNIQPEIEEEKKPVRGKRKKPNENAKMKLKVMGSVLVFACLSLFVLSRSATSIKLTYSIRETKTKIKQTQEANENIRVNIAKKSNIKKVEEVAVNKLQMIIPAKTQVIYLDIKPLVAIDSKENGNDEAASTGIIQKLIGLLN